MTRPSEQPSDHPDAISRLAEDICGPWKQHPCANCIEEARAIAEQLIAERDLALAEVERLTVAVKVQKGEDYARIGILAGQRAAVLALCDEADERERAGADGGIEMYPTHVNTDRIRRALGAEQ